jgi:hypothetical protein
MGFQNMSICGILTKLYAVQTELIISTLGFSSDQTPDQLLLSYGIAYTRIAHERILHSTLNCQVTKIQCGMYFIFKV